MKRFAFVLLLFVSTCISAQIQTSPLREQLVSAAEKYVGIREKTNHNDGPAVEKILRNVGLRKGDPWCAALMAQCHDDCNIPNPDSGFCPDWFRSNVVYERNDPLFADFKAKKGEVYGLYIEYKKRVGHVGMIKDESHFNYEGIEGNANGGGSDEGDGCYIVFRNKRSIFIISDYAMSRQEKRDYLNGKL